MKAAGLYDLLKRANRVEAPMLSMTQAERMALVACFRDDVARLSTVHGLDPPWSGRFALAAPQSAEPEAVLHVP